MPSIGLIRTPRNRLQNRSYPGQWSSFVRSMTVTTQPLINRRMRLFVMALFPRAKPNLDILANVAVTRPVEWKRIVGQFPTG
jgi:hypothetical protein